MKEKKIAVIGDNCVDVYTEPETWYLTGNVVDTGINLRRLGRPVSIITTVATDDYGQQMMDFFVSEGMDVSHVSRAEGATAVTEMKLIDNERIHGDYHEGVLATMRFTDDDVSFAMMHDWVHSAFWGMAEETLRNIKANQPACLLSYDYADHAESQRVFELDGVVDIGFFSWKNKNREDVTAFMHERYTRGMRCVVVTFGEEGSMAYDGERVYQYGSISVETVINTVGAGDAFIAGFIDAYLDSKPLSSCLQRGAEVAARVVAVFEPY